MSIDFSHRVPVCPHFACNRVCRAPAPVSQCVDITVGRYPRLAGIAGRVDNRPPSLLSVGIAPVDNSQGRKAGDGRRKGEEEGDRGREARIHERNHREMRRGR